MTSAILMPLYKDKSPPDVRGPSTTTELRNITASCSGCPAREDEEEISHQDLLPQRYHVPAVVESVAVRRWKPGVIPNIPWKFIAVLLGTGIWLGGCIGVVHAADNSNTTSWKVSPAVLLAIIGPLASIMLQYGLSCGLVITWWHTALDGTRIETLHRLWDHGTSALAAGTSGRHMDKIAFAKLLVLSLFAVNPLLQRTLSTRLGTERSTVTLSTLAATDVTSLRSMNFTDAYYDGFRSPVQLAPGMIRIMQQFNDREPMTGVVSGCNGNCSGNLVAAGIDAQCTTVHNTSFVANYGNGGGGNTPVFEISLNKMNYQTHGDFNLTILFAETEVRDSADDKTDTKQMKSCYGVSTTVHCVIQHAVVAYPFVLRDGVITPETQTSRVRVISTEPTLSTSGVTPEDSEPIFGGLSIAAGSIFNSAGILQTMGKYGWGFNTSGPLTAGYLARFDDRTCSVAFNNPTETILSRLNEIVLRVALAAPNASSPAAEFVAEQQALVLLYESHYIYLWVALAISTLALSAVVWTASGFQELGRPVSLSPVEIAIAFGSPLLCEPGSSNLSVEELIKVYQGSTVHYASTGQNVTGDTTGVPPKRLQFVASGDGSRPRLQEQFIG